jgi:hypothetical protein
VLGRELQLLLLVESEGGGVVPDVDLVVDRLLLCFLRDDAVFPDFFFCLRVCMYIP